MIIDTEYRKPAGKRIVFLDIDGPICTMRSTAAGLKYDPISVAVVNNFLQTPNTFVVMASVERKLHSTPEGMAERLVKKYGLIIPQFHEDWNTGRSMPLRQDEVQAWLDRNGRDEDTDYVSIDDDPVIIDGVFQCRADYDGIMTDQLLLLRLLAGKTRWREYKSWNKVADSRKKGEGDRICTDACDPLGVS